MNDQRIRELHSRGYLVWKIADMLGISTNQVRRSLARTTTAHQRKQPAQQAARELLAEGYSREAIERVFGVGVLG